MKEFLIMVMVLLVQIMLWGVNHTLSEGQGKILAKLQMCEEAEPADPRLDKLIQGNYNEF